jgi:deoxyribodipyrimidine photolyase-related protein
MTTLFEARLSDLTPSVQPSGERRWIFVPPDQLSDRIGPLAHEAPSELGIVLVESRWQLTHLPFHRQRIALLLANQRQFALEQARRGVAVDYLRVDGPPGQALRSLDAARLPLRCQWPAERLLREDLAPLVADGALAWVPHEGWLTTPEQFASAETPDGKYRMDRFYRRVRRDTGLLMQSGKPVGGKFSFDVENRRPWSGEPPAPEPPTFAPDDITREVMEQVERDFSDHPGSLRGDSLPATRRDAQRLWRWALDECLPLFGPFEDAMSTLSSGLFHTRISALLNLHRLLPSQVVADVEEADAPLACREGFIRQVLGWREFVRHVHDATDGFRSCDVASTQADPERASDAARPSFLGAGDPLPAAFWGEPSALDCLDRVVSEVWAESYSHHITRLMILSNLATLLDVAPRALTDWFWAAYADAWEWVVEPNVLGMGTFAVGDLMTTKPYVSGANYIHRMSDYCDGCRFHPKKNCPITPLYWAFLARHRPLLHGNRRLALPLRSLDRRSDSKKAHDREVFEWLRRALARGETIEPAERPEEPPT